MSDPAPAEKRNCIACNNGISATANVCPYCESPQNTQLCVVCGKAFPWGASRCNACSVYKGRIRRHLPSANTALSVLAVLLGVGSAMFSASAYVWNLSSDTKFKVASSTPSDVVLKVWNTGTKPSALVNYRLSLGKLPITAENGNVVTLALNPESDVGTNIVAPGAPAIIHLTTANLQTSLTEDEITPKLKNEKLTLEIDIEESNDPCCLWNLVPLRKFHTKRDSFPAERIGKFLIGKSH